MKQLMTGVALVLALGWNAVNAATAQTAPPGSVALKRGVYTTPEISRRCMDEISGISSMAGTVRQSRFLACVQRQSRDADAQSPRAVPTQADQVFNESDAQAAPRGGAMLMRGVHTTPEISRRCQDEIAGISAMAGTVRQSRFLACVQRLSAEAPVRARHAARGQADSVFEESVVGLPTQFDTDLSHLAGPYGCQTDEGYGRRGECGYL
jgi:hypothetical protein